MAGKIGLAAFIVVVLAVGLIIGATNIPGAWYQGLAKPPFNPPNWIFSPVWSALYIIIGIVGWRSWRGTDLSLKVLWAAQMGLNYLWSPSFFGLQNIALATAIIIALMGTIIAFVARAFTADRTSAWLFMPYLAWVSFATLLTVSILVLN